MKYLVLVKGTMGLIERLLKLCFAHSITDLALQTKFIAMHKSPLADSSHPNVMWQTTLIGHGLINGTGVWLVTGNVWLGLLDATAHTVIDFFSSSMLLDHISDQVLHLAVKMVIVYLWVTHENRKKGVEVS